MVYMLCRHRYGNPFKIRPEEDPRAANPDYVPVFLTEDRDLEHWLTPVEGAVNAFKVAETIVHPRSFLLKPFYAVHERRHSVYFDLLCNAF